MGRALLAAGLACSSPLSFLCAQHAPGGISWGARGILTLRHHDPVPFSRTLTELRVVQPFVLAQASGWGGRVKLHAIVDLEGLTIPNGELTLGAWGEGFVDRRHPHTYVHEVMAAIAGARGGLRGSVAIGKGFVPFGTDDPMSRPAVSYPVNHHLSQILERAVAIVAVAAGPVVLEGAAFNGDEPTAPDSWPSLDRFGDSWAVRLTGWRGPAWEAQVSHASVQSPEHREGAGPGDTKWSASVRWAGLVAGRRPGQVLAEWARTSEGGGVFAFRSILAEASMLLGSRHLPYFRFEQSERPEEERVSDFRTRLPPLDDSITGISRWTLYTAGYRYAARLGAVVLEPFIESTVGRVSEVGQGTFDPAVYYGGHMVAGLTLGFRVSYGMGDHRMGRYGVALPARQDH